MDLYSIRFFSDFDRFCSFFFVKNYILFRPRYIYILISGGSRKFWWGGILSAKPQKLGCLHQNWEWFFGRNRKFKRFFRPKSGVLQKNKKKKGLHQNWEWFFGRNRKFKRFFRPKSGVLQKIKNKKNKKKKKKVFIKIESDFSAEIGNSNDFFAQN